MGDDTWLSVFPSSFHPEMLHDFDSFNVEDLHTVDNGVIANLIPLLTNSPHAKSWDFLIGHFLGVDHVGHRVGPDHPAMKSKQEQMNDVLGRVVDALEPDTLLVVLGDHGMDRKGDHGGDGDLEVSSGMWIYSKGLPLSVADATIPSHLQKTAIFPGASVPHRRVQQIDLVSSLSLLLGLPIPFNNLGTIIPELFWRDESGIEYENALNLNLRQVNAYLATYRASSAGGELDGVWDDLQKQWGAVVSAEPSERREQSVEYTRLALETCRSLWAQFNVGLIVFGLIILGLSLVVGWGMFQHSGRIGAGWEPWISTLTRKSLLAALAGATLGAIAHMPVQAVSVFKGVSLIQFLIFGASVGSAVAIIAAAPPRVHLSWSLMPLVLHPLAFLSNSYTFWEDRIIPFLLLTTSVPAFLTSFSAPTARLRRRILFFSAVFAVCVRLMAISTVCREEQQPWCSVTYFAGGTVASPPAIVIAIICPACIFLPFAIRRVLAISKSDNGVASIFLPYILTPTLLGGTAYWMMEWIDSAQALGVGVNLRLLRTIVGWCTIGGMLLAGGALWTAVPVALHITTERALPGSGPDAKARVTVLGFANAFGAPYLIFWCIALGLTWAATQLSGQVALGFGTLALLAHLEVVDSVRDARALQDAFAADPAAALALLRAQSGQAMAELQGPGTTGLEAQVTFGEIVPLALLALLSFFATGHQATVPSLQWKSAFVLSASVTYPWSPALVLLNTLGPVVLCALAVPLVALWNVAPLPVVSAPVDPKAEEANDGRGKVEGPGAQVHRNAVRASLGVMVYFTALLLGAAAGAAVLRRHLMVWKVFAPRYMAGAMHLLAVDAGVVLGVHIGVRRVVGRVGRILGGRR